MSRIAFQDDDTRMLLWMYFGLVQGRSVKRKDLQGELVRRGVSVELSEVALRDILSVIGMAADNRIPEIDDPNEDGFPPERDEIFEAKRDYKYGLPIADKNRCYDCRHKEGTMGSKYGKCVLLNIAMADIHKSRCQKWEEYGALSLGG